MSDVLRFVKSYPAFMQSPIWADDNLFKLYHYCLYKASRNSYIWRGKVLKPGEFPASKKGAAAELNWSKNKFNRCLDALTKTGMIAVEVFSEGTLIRLKDSEWHQDHGLSICSPEP